MNDPDMGKHADVYGKEDNPYGPAHWLGPHELVYIPCPQGQLFSLLRQNLKFYSSSSQYGSSKCIERVDSFVLCVLTAKAGR